MTDPQFPAVSAEPAHSAGASGADPDAQAWWAYVPRSPAAALAMAQRARAEGRPVPPAVAALAGLPEDAAPASAPTLTEPPEPPAAAPRAALAGTGVFTIARRVRFLDHLAINGNARAAAAHARVSHDSAYRARRQDPAFAVLWDAALVHAREQSASVLATRALDGVEVPVWYHGEVVGTRTVHDPRLLLAHMARLDRQVEANPAARAHAERFDELLAGYAGHAQPEGFASPAGAAPGTPALPPTRAAYVAWLREAMTEDIGCGPDDDAAWFEAVEEAEQAAGSAWDAWRAEALARVGAIVAGDEPDDSPLPAQAGITPEVPAKSGEGEAPAKGAEEAGLPPIEFKSAASGPPARPGAFLPLDRVASVRSPSPPDPSPSNARPPRKHAPFAPSGDREPQAAACVLPPNPDPKLDLNPGPNPERRPPCSRTTIPPPSSPSRTSTGRGRSTAMSSGSSWTIGPPSRAC